MTTTDPELDARVRQLRYMGQTGVKHEHLVLGYQERLDELQAAFLRVKLRHLEEQVEGRRRVAARYARAGWPGRPSSRRPTTRPAATPTTCTRSWRPDREELRAHLDARGHPDAADLPQARARPGRLRASTRGAPPTTWRSPARSSRACSACRCSPSSPTTRSTGSARRSATSTAWRLTMRASSSSAAPAPRRRSSPTPSRLAGRRRRGGRPSTSCSQARSAEKLELVAGEFRDAPSAADGGAAGRRSRPSTDRQAALDGSRRRPQPGPRRRPRARGRSTRRSPAPSASPARRRWAPAASPTPCGRCRRSRRPGRTSRRRRRGRSSST